MVDGMLWQHAGEAPMMRLVIRNVVVEAGVHVDNAELLKELRIERHQREDQGRNPGRWLWIGGAAVVLLLLLGGVARLFFGQHAITVQTATAVAPSAGGEAGAVLQATGYVTARRRATVLAQLDDHAWRAALDAARAQAAAAHALVAQYQTQLAQNERDAARQKELAAQGLVPKQVAEQARTLADSTRAQLAAQRKQVAAADAQAAVAQVNFDYCVVRAPFDGVVTTKDAQVGEIISPLSAGGGFTRTGVGTVVDMDSLEIDVDVNEAYIGRIKPGMPAEAVLDAYPDWKIPAHVIAIVPTADRGKATIKVRVALEKKDARVVPDMGARVSFLEAQPKAAASVPQGVLVPATAIAQRDGRSVVFVLDGQQVRQRAVNPAMQAYGELRLLPAAVKPGERMVLSPPAELRDGSAVQIRKP